MPFIHNHSIIIENTTPTSINSTPSVENSQEDIFPVLFANDITFNKSNNILIINGTNKTISKKIAYHLDMLATL